MLKPRLCMDAETDFLTPEFVYTLILEQRNLIIYPYVIPGKLAILRSLLSIFYEIQDFDLQDVSDSLTAASYFMMISDQNSLVMPNGEKQTLLFLTHGLQDLFKDLDKFPHLRFISFETNLPPSISPSIAIYNKKLTIWDHLSFPIASEDPTQNDAWAWCDFIHSELQANPDASTLLPELEQFWKATNQFALELEQNGSYSGEARLNIY